MVSRERPDAHAAAAALASGDVGIDNAALDTDALLVGLHIDFHRHIGAPCRRQRIGRRAGRSSTT